MAGPERGIEAKPRVPAYWPIALGAGVNILAVATDSVEGAAISLIPITGGIVVAGGDFVCDRISNLKDYFNKTKNNDGNDNGKE